MTVSQDISSSIDITNAVFDHAATTPDHVVFQRPTLGEWHDVTAAEFARIVCRCGS
ncbi:hypothetical protein [Nocardia camponoti]|uniref:hypothetical protein n=1 Tax=Nocardia camponoti TaxID=1616106 RepID=UPI00166AFCA9|nr:hypothetical protein [Nocardia camponoti]